MNDSLPRTPAPPARTRSVLPACARIGALDDALARLDRGDSAGAWSGACRALAQRPFHPEAMLLLAGIATAEGDPEGAGRCLTRVRRMAPAFRLDLRPALARPEPASGPGSRNGGQAKPDWLTWPAPLVALPSEERPRLSVCLIARDEEAFLGSCLRSVRAIADQIILVDTGSVDRTVEIALAAGAEVRNFPWQDDFAAARNASIESATGDWILVLDADEELPPGQHDVLRGMLGQDSVISWRLPIQVVGREDEACSFVPRLFRNVPGAHFVGRVHEQAFSSLEPARRSWGLECRRGEALLRHRGYSAELTRSRDKVARNLRLLELELVERPGDAGLLLHSALELVRSGRAAEGLERYRLAFRAMSRQPAAEVVPEARDALLEQFTARLISVGNHSEVVDVLSSPLAGQGEWTPDLHFTLGVAFMELKRPDEAAARLRSCLATRDDLPAWRVGRLAKGPGPRHCLALCSWRSGDPEAAEASFGRARSEHPASVPVVQDFARFLHRMGRPGEALAELQALAGVVPGSVDPWILGGTIALAAPGLREVALDWTSVAVGRFPDELRVREQRAEALLLAGHLSEALPLWRELAGDGSPRRAAGRILCECAAGLTPIPPADAAVPAVTREFLGWYRRLLEFGAGRMIEAIGSSLDRLRPVLPDAAGVVAAVLAEAGAEVGGAVSVVPDGGAA